MHEDIKIVGWILIMMHWLVLNSLLNISSRGTDVVYIIIVSHGHDDYIENLLLNLKLPSGRFKIIVRDNKSSMVLKTCEKIA